MTIQPKDVAAGEVNKRNESRNYSQDYWFLQRKRTEQSIFEDGFKDRTMFYGYAIERGVMRRLSDIDIRPSVAHSNSQDVLVVRVWCPDLHGCFVHPDRNEFNINGNLITREFLMSVAGSSLIYVAANSDISQKGIPDAGDLVMISRDPIAGDSSAGLYHGIVQKSTLNAGSKIRTEKKEDNTPGLEDTTKEPIGGSPIPGLNETTVDSKTDVTTKKQPGLYEVREVIGKKPNQQSIYKGKYQMVIVPGASVLFPKRYIKVVEALMNAYKEETGQSMGIRSGYRDIEEQRILYERYTSGKTTNVTAPPGFSKHNNGTGIDFQTYTENNDLFKLQGSSEKQTALQQVKTGNFGQVAKWLAENSTRFGFEWTGYLFDELWHYELRPENIPAELAGDTEGDIEA